jgi:hypothetical protein
MVLFLMPFVIKTAMPIYFDKKGSAFIEATEEKETEKITFIKFVPLCRG